MAGKKDNIKALFSNTRTRVIILFTVILLCLTVVIGVFKFGSVTNKLLPTGGADLKRVSPGIRSIPGALDQTVQYATLQETQNITQAETASKKGGSAIPTLIKTQRFGEGVDFIGNGSGEGGLGFTALASEGLGGEQKDEWIQALKKQNCSRDTIKTVTEKGADIAVLYEVCSCAKLREYGYTLVDLASACSCPELKAIAFTATELKSVGFTPEKLKRCGFSACETRGAEFSAEEMKIAGFSDGELRGAGFSVMEIAAASGLPEGIDLEDVGEAGCEVSALKEMREAGVSAAVLHRASACDPANFKAAGFTAAELRRAGLTAAALLADGFELADLKQAGYGARDLLKAGVAPQDLVAVGFTNEEIKTAQKGLAPLPRSILAMKAKGDKDNVDGLRAARAAGVSASVIREALASSAEAMKAAGFTAQELKDAGYNAAELDDADFSLKEMKDAGYSVGDLRATGYDPKELKAVGFSLADLRSAGFSAEEMKEAGFSAADLKQAGYSAAELLKAGFSSDELAAAGFSVAEIDAIQRGLTASTALPESLRALQSDINNIEGLRAARDAGVSASMVRERLGSSAKAMRAAGFTLDELKSAGFSPSQLKAAGYTLEQLKAAGFSAKQLEEAGYTLEQLKAAGYTLEQLKAAGFTPRQLKAAGYTLEQLKAAGFNAKQLEAAGFSAAQLKASGFTAKQLKAAGFSSNELTSAGFSDAEIKAIQLGSASLPDSLRAIQSDINNIEGLRAAREAGVSAEMIRDHLGSSADAMRAAGFSAEQLKAAGFSARQLSVAGFGADELKAAGFSAEQLEAAGLSVEDLKAVGFGAEQLKAAGMSARQLKAAGFSAGQLKAAGFSAEQLEAAGFSIDQLEAAGFSAGQLKAAGFSAEQLKAAGFSAEQLKATGFGAGQLKAAGLSAAELKAAGFGAAQLEEAGFSAAELKAAGFTAGQLKAAGLNAAQLKSAGFSAAQLKAAGFSAEQLKAAGFSIDQLKAAGFGAEQLEVAGFSADQLEAAGFAERELQALSARAADDALSIDSIASASAAKREGRSEAKELQALMARQQGNKLDQRYKEQVKQSKGRMLSAAQNALNDWKKVPTQVFIEGSEKDQVDDDNTVMLSRGAGENLNQRPAEATDMSQSTERPGVFIKTGDILFAVLDTSVNTDEPGPILATIVSGKLKGSKLIGSFTLPSNANKMVLTFNTLSMLGSDKTISISSYAIDPSTARTALAGRVNHHYLMRYGSLFASTFLAGFSSAIQSADTTITIGGTGGTTDTTVQNGINRSLLENTLIGLGEVGKAWSETAQQLMNRPTTVELYSGTGMGILFTQDVQLA